VSTPGRHAAVPPAPRGDAGPAGPAPRGPGGSTAQGLTGLVTGWLPLAGVLVAGAVVRLLDPADPAGAGGPAGAPAGLTTTAATAAALVAAAAVGLLVRRWGGWGWLAALAAAPAALGPAQLAAAGRGALEPVLVALVALGLLAVLWRAASGVVAALVGLVCAAGASLAVLAASAGAPDDGALGVLAPLAGEPLVGGQGPDGLLGALAPSPAETGAVLVALVLALAAVLGLGRARPSRSRGAVATTAVVPLLLAAAPLLVEGLTPAAALPALAVVPAAGALAVTALLRGRRGRRAGPVPADDVDRAAVADLHARVGVPALAPVVVAVAAYDEEGGIGAVLDRMPTELCGLPVDVLVVDDGSADGTAAVVAAHPRALSVACPVNRGQGAALRLAYRVAREHGARLVVTTDADGQYDVADMPAVLGPVVRGEADFVTGSRLLGRQETRDRVRRTGVHVFAGVVTLLTGHRTTDTSFGLRAMRADLTGVVTLRQPQYQSSELLLGAHSHGYRVAEVPASMAVRAAGSSKKGKNLVYGSRYARVVLGTAWREGLPSPVTEVAPALRP